MNCLLQPHVYLITSIGMMSFVQRKGIDSQESKSQKGAFLVYVYQINVIRYHKDKDNGQNGQHECLMQNLSRLSVFCPPPGSFYSYYGNYDYTYISSGILLMVASVMLFVGMGINYRLLAREKKDEEKMEKEGKEEAAAMLAPPSPSKSDSGRENDVKAVSLDDVAKMDEDTV